MTAPAERPGVTRREVIQRVSAALGGAALAGGERVFGFSFDAAALESATAQGAGSFTTAEIALLDEVAETILPETATPGAKAARTGAFMALMVTAAYTERDRDVFRAGMQTLDAACRQAHGAGFLQASPAQRLSLLESLDREQQTVMEERANAPRSRAPAAEAAPDQPAHYFRMMKELTLLGFFTSEIGCTKAMRYIETPGRFDPCVPHAPGDRSWAGHA
jgi:hypothetical protein